MKRIRKVIIILNLFRVVPAYAFMKTAKQKDVIAQDFRRWESVLGIDYNTDHDIMFLGYLLVFKKEYRNLMLYRMKRNLMMYLIFSILWKKMDTLYILTPSIGGGLFIQHGFSTIIAASSMGENCWVNQQVTIGYKGKDSPVICDNVMITAGAKVLGNVTLNDGCVIGANAVVTHDVPANSVAVGIPAHVIKYITRNS